MKCFTDGCIIELTGECVYYSGTLTPYLKIADGTKLNKVIQIIDEKIQDLISNTVLTAEDTQSVKLTLTGTDGTYNIKADTKLSSQAGNTLTLLSDGLYNSATGVPTEYDAGTGLRLNATVFSHDITTTQGSVTNTGATFIQSLGFDEFGHVTSVNSAPLQVGTGLQINGNVITNSEPGSSQPIFKNIANSLGETQFSAGSNNDTLKIEGKDGATVAFDTINKKITISASAPSYIQGAGINIIGNQITNSAPDRTVVLSGAGAATVSGTYPNFTITSSDTTYTQFDRTNNGLVPSPGGATQERFLREDGTWVTPPASTPYTPGSGIAISGNTIANTAPDRIVTLTGFGGTTIMGTYPNFAITSTTGGGTDPATFDDSSFDL